MVEFKDNVTIGEKYGPAMQIETEDDAKRYLESCVTHAMRVGGMTRDDATRRELDNIGYYAGYYDEKTRERVERLFGAVHPLLGSTKIKRPPKEIFDLGFRIGTKTKGKRH